MSAQWEVRFSNTRTLPYFYDSVSGTSSWEPPTGLSDQQIKSLPGAAQYLQQASAESGSTSNGVNKIRASHLLVKHAMSRRPSSHRQVRAQ